MALANFGHFLGLWDSCTEAEVHDWYTRLTTDTFTGQGGVEYNKAHAFLPPEWPKHGVSPQDAPARAAMALKKLGVGPVLKAASAKSPWQALKSLGNSQEKPFQWIQHEELERHINSKALDKKTLRRRPRRSTEPNLDHWHWIPVRSAFRLVLLWIQMVSRST